MPTCSPTRHTAANFRARLSLFVLYFGHRHRPWIATLTATGALACAGFQYAETEPASSTPPPPGNEEDEGPPPLPEDDEAPPLPEEPPPLPEGAPPPGSPQGDGLPPLPFEEGDY